MRGCRFHRHHTFPHSDWITLPIDGMLDVPAAMNALRMAHARISDAEFPGQTVTVGASPEVRNVILS